ncbi:MAG TPA: rhodanese-like domain-containing protein [Acidiferrobacter sp.]|nr:rhodanese-like domain-containing protein [Acidiferrobacter sp.]
MWQHALTGAAILAHAGLASHLLAITAIPRSMVAGAVVVDTRPVAVCVHRSFTGSRCLAPREFLGPHGRLVNMRDIRWLLGTAGLSGAETVVVVGDHMTRENFVAGILYLAGQRRVEVAYQSFTPWLAAQPEAATAGSAHGMLRQPIYTAWPRTRLIVLRGELARLLKAGSRSYLLDGRPLSQYWGRQIRGLRGGHIPGAQPFPMGNLRRALGAGDVQLPPVGSAIAYAQDPYRSIAYFAFLRILGLPVHVFPGGWVDWSTHTNLPVDSETYPTYSNGQNHRPAVTHPTAADRVDSEDVIALIAALIVAVFLFRLTRRP